MIHFHGNNKTHQFFEGWYLKHQTGDATIAVIPAFHINKKGKKTASIQVITDTGSYWKAFPVKVYPGKPFTETDFYAKKDRFYCKIGENIFSEKGIFINLEFKDLTIRGKLLYDAFLPLKSDIMGPFQYIPFLKCNHGVLSLSHKLKGHLLINDKKVDFTNGTGYIEKDWGVSFPDSYLWTQCNWYEKSDCCIMVSIADIPFPFGSFTGCICCIYYDEKEYRLATYLGVRILKYTKREIILVQGTYRLEIKLLEQKPFSLKAPVNGSMERIIRQSPVCTVKYRFLNNGREVFRKISSQAGFEYAKCPNHKSRHPEYKY